MMHVWNSSNPILCNTRTRYHLRVTNDDYGVTSSRPDNGVMPMGLFNGVCLAAKSPIQQQRQAVVAAKSSGLRLLPKKEGAFASCNQIFVQ
jgi:hypothetical protein